MHAKTRTEAWETWNRIQADVKAQAERDAEYARYRELALRMRYCVTDSTAVGNCMAGTLSFLSRLGVDPDARPKTGRSILRAARRMGLQKFAEMFCLIGGMQLMQLLCIWARS